MNTINGFDLLLVIIITLLGYKVYRLNLECESYVGQILKISWNSNSPYNPNCKDCYGWEEYCGLNTHFIDPPYRNPAYDCDFCTESKPMELYPECTCAPHTPF